MKRRVYTNCYVCGKRLKNMSIPKRPIRHFKSKECIFEKVSTVHPVPAKDWWG